MSISISEFEKLGLGRLEELDIYDDKEKTDRKKEPDPMGALEKTGNESTDEKQYLFDKTYRCVICDREFKNKTVMTGKTRLISVDLDLRPRYSGVDCIKYDSVVCPYCGYGALTRFYGGLTAGQTKLVKEKICQNYKPFSFGEETYSYDEAIVRYQLCLANSVAKKSKYSERAYACLKIAWLYRSKAEMLEEETMKDTEQLVNFQMEEQKYIATAYDGFTKAMANEMFPICGMDEYTYTYMLADLARRCKDYQTSVNLIARVLMSKTASPKVKERTRVLKELVKKEVQ